MEHIDLAFAKLVDEKHTEVLAALFAHSRQGHLAMESQESLPPNPYTHQDGNLLYLQKNWIYETQIVTHLERLHRATPSIAMTASLDPHLNAQQQQAIIQGMSRSLFLLTGGPGTGKTYTAAQWIKTAGMRVIATAPTGKAVAQLEASLRRFSNDADIQSGTLHGLLGIQRRETEELYADLIIVDECSMIDAKIFAHLLAAVPSGARLLLIGDKDQLPPVEAGSIFADILDAGVYPSVELTTCLRSEQSDILTLATAIKQGNAKIACDDLSLTQIWEHGKDRFPSYHVELPPVEELLRSMGRYCILSCVRRGPYGVDAINRLFINQYMREAPANAWWTIPIMITRNHEEMDLYNGDLGILVRKAGMDDYALFHDRRGGYRQIHALALPSFEYAYCFSVHKSQGSECDEALILIPPGSEQFGREVLYTAVTRARRKVSLAGSKELLAQAIATSSRKKSGLTLRIKKYE